MNNICDRGPKDAVVWWKKAGYKYGPKSHEARNQMRDPDNQRFEHGPKNFSRSGSTLSRYKDPL